tara:strand:- start:95 stop:454 length:360 start_codon:yes stop_codon:yes gene_type:complete
MIPLETYRTIVDQTEDLDELLQIKENIRKQKYDVMRDFDRLLQENIKTTPLPDIQTLLQGNNVSQVANVVQEWGKQKEAQNMMSTQRDFNKTIVAYDNLLKCVSEKCSKLIWGKDEKET